MSRVERNKDSYTGAARQEVLAKQAAEKQAAEKQAAEKQAAEKQAAEKQAPDQASQQLAESAGAERQNGTAAHAEKNEKAEKSKKSEKKEKGGRKKGRITVFGRLLRLIGSLIMICAVLVSLALGLPRFAKIDSYVVISGSMEPAIPVGSMVYAKACNPAEVQVDDVIVFYTSQGGTPVTHRVVRNDTGAGEITTKGDANGDVDLEPVIYENVIGKVMLHIPKLGALAAPLATLTGKISIILIVLAGYLLIEAGSRMRRRT